MGKVLEMTQGRTVFAAVSVALLALGGCGSDRDATANARLVKSLAMGVITPKSAAPAAPAPQMLTREQLAAITVPVLQVTLESRKATALMFPAGQNGDVITWGTVDDNTISTRSGVLVASRGLTNDLMSAVAPSAAQIARGSGSHERVYFTADGADQTRRHVFQCSLAVAGRETIAVMQRAHSTRHVTERCSGAEGHFVNHYWFENGSKIRQSRQLLVPGSGQIATVAINY